MNGNPANNGSTISQQALQTLMNARERLAPSVRALIAAGGPKLNSEFSGGITAGFAILSLRGKVWRTKYQGEERLLLQEDGRTPRYHVDLIFVRSTENISKVWYDAGYVEGSTAPPDCWSANGKVPDPASPKLQSQTCGGCRWNAWGSARTSGGSGKGKDCADSKRLAVVPAGDVDNATFGGPMLLRVPPASLGNMLTYANSLEQIGIPLYSLVTRVYFDVDAEYPRLMFQPMEPLGEDDVVKVLAMRDNPLTDRILNAVIDEVHTDGIDESHTGQAAQQVQQAPQQRPQQAPQQAPRPTGAPATPVPVQAVQPQPQPAQAPSAQAPDPNAERRKGLRDMNVPEAVIEQMLGPVPKPEQPKPVEDPRIAQLKAMNFNDEQIKTMLATLPQGVPATPKGNEAAPGWAKDASGGYTRIADVADAVQAAQPAGEKRRRRTKAEMEAAKAAQGVPAAQAAQALPAGPASDEPELPGVGDGDVPAGALPAELQAELDRIIGKA